MVADNENANAPRALLRVLHAAPNAPAVDVYINNRLAATNLSFKQLTRCLPVTPGTANLKVYPTGNKETPAISAVLRLTPGTAQTIAVTGLLPNLSLLNLPEPTKTPKIYQGYVRFAHLSPNAPPVKITLPDGTVLFDDVEYREVTQYTTVKPGTYTLQVRLAGKNLKVLEVPNVKLDAGKFYTVYALGLAGGDPPLTALVAKDGCSDPTEARAIIKGGPLAPKIDGTVTFKDVPNGTVVCVEIRGLPAYKPATGSNPPIGPHGFHIHENGSCEVGDPANPFQATGGHWNPTNQPHGNHPGDFPVIFSNHGYARMCFFTDKFKVDDVIGKSIVIHENPDDYRTQPAGASGKRLACGVINPLSSSQRG